MKNSSIVRVIAGLSAVSAMGAAVPESWASTLSRRAGGCPHPFRGQPHARRQGGSLVRGGRGCDYRHMTLNSIRRAFSGLVAEDRPSFKRVDASPARADDGSWLNHRRWNA